MFNSFLFDDDDEKILSDEISTAVIEQIMSSYAISSSTTSVDEFHMHEVTTDQMQNNENTLANTEDDGLQADLEADNHSIENLVDINDIQSTDRRKRHYENMELAKSCIKKKKRVTSSLGINSLAMEYLTNGEFGNFLRTKLSKKDCAISEIVKRLSQYTSHVTNKFSKPLPPDGNYNRFLINAILTPTTIVTYMDYCSEVDGYQPCSLTVRLDDLSNFIHYVMLYETCIPHDFVAANGSIKQYRTLLKKMQSNEDKKNKSAEAILSARKFPAGGLAQLQSIMDSDLNYFESRCEQFQFLTPPRDIYLELIGYVFASLWVYSPQARAAAIETLSLSDGTELVKSRSVGSSHFKSVATHKVQPLILQDEKAVKIVQNYIDILRPTSTHPQLFLQYNGKPFQQGAMSQYIKQYFQRSAGLNLSVNSLRKVQCSEVYVASVDGRVSESARKHFNYIQGHSERSNDAVYVKLALQANSDIARSTFSKLGSKISCSIETTTSSELSKDPTSSGTHQQYNNTSQDADLVGYDNDHCQDSGSCLDNIDSITPSQTTNVLPPLHAESLSIGMFPWPRDYLTFYDDWGTKHSCATKLASRVPWDKAEKEWLRNCMEAKSNQFYRAIDKWKQLLQEVIDDPNARPLFHRNHVADHTRLREGLRAKRVSNTA